MRTIRNYAPPSPVDLAELKERTGRSSAELAAMAGVSDGRQWRKYTGPEAREMAAPSLFMLAAHLALSDDEMGRVIARMREIGASFDFEDAPR
ncbi:MAG: XRE family transcriptional regulator [Burkholderiales bacterium]|nr:XRE family transcriptional regulator [Burkholderiales bacterium]